MNNTQNNKIDNILRHAVRQVTPESPNQNLVPSVMLIIEQIGYQKRHAIQHEPLISWKGWFVIGAIIIGFFTLIFYMLTPDFSFGNSNQYINNFISSYFSVFLSRLFVVGMVILTVFFVLQIWLVVQRKEREMV